MFLIYGIFYLATVIIGSIIIRIAVAVILATIDTVKENSDQQALLKMDPNSKEYLSRYMPKV